MLICVIPMLIGFGVVSINLLYIVKKAEVESCDKHFREKYKLQLTARQMSCILLDLAFVILGGLLIYMVVKKGNVSGTQQEQIYHEFSLFFAHYFLVCTILVIV